MTENTVAIAAIALAGTSIASVIWVVKWLAKTLSVDLREHTKAALIGAQASREQKKASTEVLVFMKNLNGKLAQATIQTATNTSKILHSLDDSATTLAKDTKRAADAVKKVKTDLETK
mgnify:CR=1 FL=1